MPSTAPTSTFPVRFHRDEQGSVMVLTIILTLLLLKVALSTYNVGVLTAERVRIQTVADTAAYSAATWQARFLNYCAYSQRAMIANLSNMETLSAADSNAQFIKKYYDEDLLIDVAMILNPLLEFIQWQIDRLLDDWFIGALIPEWVKKAIRSGLDAVSGAFFENIGFNIMENDWTAFPRLSATVLNAAYNNAGYDGVIPSLRKMHVAARESADHMNYLMSTAQEAMYLYTSQPWLTVIPDIVDKANKPFEVIGSNGQLQAIHPVEIEVSRGFQGWGMGMNLLERPGILGKGMIEERKVDTLQVAVHARRDRFTRGQSDLSLGFSSLLGGGWFADFINALFTNLPTFRSMPYFASRPYWGVDLLTFIPHFRQSPLVAYIDAEASGEKNRMTEVELKFNQGPRAEVTSYDGPTPAMLPALQFIRWIQVWVIPVPIIIPIQHRPNKDRMESKYISKYAHEEITYYAMRDDLKPEEMEPSVYAVLKISRDKLVKEDGTGKLFHHSRMPLGETVESMYAISRAKVFFLPGYPELESFDNRTSAKPNLYYPYWDAKLAPFWGPYWEEDILAGGDVFSPRGGQQSTTLQANGLSLLAAIEIERMIEKGSGPDLSTQGFLWKSFRVNY